ncbi:transposase [Hymenobacter sp. B1770]|uniref:transposase n=1 Tax=Hymenobacter sp. B1770 TaxID=1718788 RepID=UPI003CEF0850
MEEHIRALLQRFQYSEQFKETAAFRIVFGGEEPSQVMADLDIHNSYTLRNWVSLYQRKLQTGLFVSPAMTRTQKRDVQALRQRNEELEQTLQQANLLILALHTMIEVAEQELQVPIRKKSGIKQSWGFRKMKSPG